MDTETLEFPVPPVRKLTKQELERIDRIDLRYAYDFAPLAPPKLLTETGRKKVSLSAFLDNQEFPFATLDIVDRREIDYFDISGFYHNIDLNRVHLPGELSAVTTAKVIGYMLDLLWCEFSCRFEKWADTGKMPRISDFTGDGLIRSIRARAVEIEKDNDDEVNVYKHFVCAEKNPVIGLAVRNAAINRWGMLPPKSERAA